ncbi:MAG: gamma-glutamylcyclotransferase [Oscillibacter sp.]|nr:gamma-glutamylcyclotransferase [Oscillibacter sp.]
MGLFAENGAAQFIGQHPDLCPEFNECFAQAADFLRRDAVRGAWGDDYTERAHEIAKTIDRETQRLYLAYGSNLNVAQMNFRCPDAKIVGTAELKDHRLMFKGSGTGNYLTVEPESGCAVPVAVWSVSEADEASLDRYEGFPRFYYKKNVTLEMLERESGQTRTVNAFVYVMHEDRELGAPRDDYYERCMEGYEHFGFDPQLLAEAREYSSRK